MSEDRGIETTAGEALTDDELAQVAGGESISVNF
jgi:bacteriocin-like protein